MKRKGLIFLSLIAWSIVLVACGSEKDSTDYSTPADVKKEDYKEIVTPNNTLGFEMLSEVEPDDDGNVFISPTSLFMALSMVYNGAEGQTKDEIANALQVDKMETDMLNRANASLIEHLKKDAKSIQLSIANSIWLNENYHFQHDFAKSNQDYFDAQIEEIDITKEASVDKINDWVSKATNEKIDKMLEAPLDPDLVAYLLNAIYFKGDWLYEFDEKETMPEDFYLQDGRTKEVSMMTLAEDLRYLENDLFQAVELPYDGETMRMNIVLPKENINTEEFHQKFTLNNWNDWLESFEIKEGTVKLPKFKMSYEIDLKDTLMQLGMNRAFAPGAEFNRLIEEEDPVWISKVKQKTFIAVDEKGTEAAAATGVEMVTESAVLDESFFFEANRPFILIITDEETGAILFMGEIGNPVEEVE